MNLCGGRIVGSMALPGSNPARQPGAASPQFPAGLRVLVVDDDPTCLKILEKMLQACQYEVTKCDRAECALNELRRNRNGFDIVLSDVHMRGMDGFKLLEHIGLETDLPVIMMSADDGKNAVMKGVTNGACDYLIKPVRIEALKNIWQHVVRKKKNEWKYPEQSGSVDEAVRVQKQEDTKYSLPHVVWSVELHQQFVAAVNQLGIDKAVPEKILEMMNVPGLTRESVASHLQKYRSYLRRLSEVPLVAFAAQLPGQNHSGYQPGLARPGIKPEMSMPFVEQRNLEIFNFDASKLRGFTEGKHLQQLSNANNKQMNLLHGIPGFHQFAQDDLMSVILKRVWLPILLLVCIGVLHLSKQSSLD